jgi:IS605 OrfB family transposase
VSFVVDRAQPPLARKQKGSANRRKAVRRVAVGHRRVRETRLDHHHKLALRLVRDNQAVDLESLSVAGLARTRLARSIHDAGWSILVRLIEEKAAHHGRTVVKVDQRFPSSQLCSSCGHRDGPKPLSVRSWTCPACGVKHDRNLNSTRHATCWPRDAGSPSGWRRSETPVELASDLGLPEQSAAKQEPASRGSHEPSWRNSGPFRAGRKSTGQCAQ